jgi:hypothetical protein
VEVVERDMVLLVVVEVEVVVLDPMMEALEVVGLLILEVVVVLRARVQALVVQEEKVWLL